MKHFAVFMEQQGYVQKRQFPSESPKEIIEGAKIVPNPQKKAKKVKSIGDQVMNKTGDGNHVQHKPQGYNKNLDKTGARESTSEVIIYKRAVDISVNGDNEIGENMLISGSSDESNNNSDESNNSMGLEADLNMFAIADKAGVEGERTVKGKQDKTEKAVVLTPKEKAEQRICNAEKAKARLLEVKGNQIENLESDSLGHLIHSVLVDEEYSAIASHLDENMRRSIMTGEYVDFVRLLPRDRIQLEQDQWMEIVNRGGMTYWVPVSDRNSATISNIAKWEEAFRIFSRIYTEGNPFRAIELIQYNHIIHEAALEYPWESVYAYDREFRIHMSKYPSCNWGIILQQAWTLKLHRSGVGGSGSVTNHTLRSRNR